MIPPLLVRRRSGVASLDEWVPTEQPGLALARYDQGWRLVHIRSGLCVAGCEDRALLLDLGLPALAHVDFTASAPEVVRTHPTIGDELRLLGLAIGGERHHDASDLDQHPALAPLAGRPS